MCSINYSSELFKIILNQLNQFATEKVVFWGASLFLKEFLDTHNLNKYNIIGIIDNDSTKQNMNFCGFKIYSYHELEKISNVNIIFTIKNNHINNYRLIAKLIKDNIKNKSVKLLPNIFQTYFSVLTDNFKVPTVNNLGFNYIYPTSENIECFNKTEKLVKNYSEIIPQDNLFLISLINKYKPKKILEVGVSKGGSSFVIINAMQKDAKLYSLDYNTQHYMLKNRETGYFLDKYPILKQKMELYTGGLSLKFLDKISSSIDNLQKFDFCLLDTAHAMPGEVLDFLQVLPYLKDDAIVVLHDINLHLNRFEDSSREYAYSSNVLFSALKGQKIMPYYKPFSGLFGEFFSNIGAVQLNKESFKNYFDIFNLLTLKWRYSIPDNEILECVDFIRAHYGEYYAEYFRYIAQLQKIQN